MLVDFSSYSMELHDRSQGHCFFRSVSLCFVENALSFRSLENALSFRSLENALASWLKAAKGVDLFASLLILYSLRDDDIVRGDPAKEKDDGATFSQE
ncbi:hypothetical protein HHK36_019564 [Tetracentron sinense]|uniref:Uncharacterized protein n=1 Tax=Tetracentron sinense TaxID=13715 RepID=A0A835DCV7_TETSI|nr:hypothetical protein HHK36_019564 [Tetracentron sinense]